MAQKHRQLVAPPLYVMVTNCLDKTLGIETLEKAILKIEEVIRKAEGNLVIKMKVGPIDIDARLSYAHMNTIT